MRSGFFFGENLNLANEECDIHPFKHGLIHYSLMLKAIALN